MDMPEMNVDKDSPILKKDRMSTGIKDLDLILEGGYKNPANIMVLGPTGVEKMMLAFQFVAVGLKKPDEYILFISSDSAIENVMQRAQSIGIKLDAPNFLFIDCYTSNTGDGQEPSEKRIVVPGPSALNDLSLAINEGLTKANGKKIRVVFSSLSTFMLYNPIESILKFLQVVCGRLMKANATTLMLVEEGVHEKKLLSVIEHMMDEKFEITEKDGMFSIDVPEISDDIPIKLGPTGISII
jgi:KaiC/GvpD/RAD55 family RecA-like ATPase